jgi:hypothetical protein
MNGDDKEIVEFGGPDTISKKKRNMEVKFWQICKQNMEMSSKILSE